MTNNTSSIAAVEELLEERKPLTEFKDFFTLPDGEKVAGFFWHDKFGNETTNPKKLIEKIPFILPQTKQAATIEDFELIYQRELEKQKSNDNANFKRWVVKKVYEMKNFQQSLPADKDKISLDLQNLSDKFLNWVDYRNKDNCQYLSFIDPSLQPLFLEKEAKAKNKNGEWDSKIRCAAFCELLWDNKYLGKKKHRINQCNAFAKAGYFDINNQFQYTKIKERTTHKSKLAYLFK